MVDDAVLDWLLSGDPVIAWQTLRDLAGATEAAQHAQRARMPQEGWGAEVLGWQLPSGDWGGQESPDDAWRYNLTALELLRLFEVEPGDPTIARHIQATREHVRWPSWFGSPPYFDGEEEACSNGQVLAQGAAFGVPSDALAVRLLGEQLEDGGWNCDAPRSRRGSFNSTICVLEGLLAYEQHTGGSPEISAARERGEHYLVERGLLRRASTGELIDDRFLRFGWPSRWRFDVLRALDHLRQAGWHRDPRLHEALEAVRSRQQDNGRWLTESAPLDVPIAFFEEPGTESRFITLRALRVLRHFDAIT